jgi:hypothetical protein
MLTLADFGRSVGLTLTFAPLIAVAVATVVLAIAHILHLAVTVGAPRAVTVTAVVVALAAVVLARRSSALATRRGAATARRANTSVCTVTTTVGAVATVAATLRALTTGTVTTGVKPP